MIPGNYHGLFTRRLTPSDHNEVLNRDGFLLHAGKTKDPGTASQGCIVMSRDFREKLAKYDGGTLIVTH